MEPSISTSFDGPQYDDILGAQRHYGDFFESSSNDTSANATDLGTIAVGSTVTVGADATTTLVAATAIDFVSIDDDLDVDYYQFTVTADALNLDIVLNPVGPTYNQELAPGAIAISVRCCRAERSDAGADRYQR